MFGRAALFLGLAVGLSSLWGSMRLRTGSVWGAILGHSAWNAIIEGPFTGYTRGESATLWLGEYGIADHGMNSASILSPTGCSATNVRPRSDARVCANWLA